VAVVPSALVFLLFVLAGGAIMGIVYGDYFTSGATVLAILSFARVYAVYTGSCGAALMMTGHQRTMMTLTVMTGFISLGAEVFAAPKWGMTGVATATACAQILQNTLQLAFTKIRLGIWTHARFTLGPVRAMLRR
jgi:O-antigen/teichoic acid export membrane protein